MVGMAKYKLFNGDCLEVMDRLIKNNRKVDLTVTSPPYDNLRCYEGTLQWNEGIWKKAIEKLYKITADGGMVVWIVNDSTIKGSETGTSFKQALYFKEVGFNLHDTMIWKKTNPFNMGSNKCYIQGKPKSLNLIKDRKNKSYKENDKKQVYRRRKSDFMEYGKGSDWEMKEFSKRYNIWENSVSSKYKGHSATFPENLVTDHILSWSNEGDIVFDPFMGSGTTGVCSLRLNRKFVGIEKVTEYFNYSKERIIESI